MKVSVWVGFCSLGLALSGSACGGVSDGDDGDDGAADAGVESDAEVDDQVAPEILSITPADGATKVSADTPIVVTFSEAMDPTATVAALTITGSLAGTPETSWSEGGTVLTIDAGLQEATGTDPAMVEALAYEVEIGEGAADLAGNTVEAPASVSFTTARRITLSLLTEVMGGSNAQSGHSQQGETRYSFLCAGDAEDDGETRAYVTYDISVLPDGIPSLAEATFHGDVYSVAGDPTGVFGDLLVEHVVFASWTAEAWAADPLRSLPALLPQGTAVAVGDHLSVDVTEAVQEDYELRDERGNRTQLRFRFAAAPNPDGVTDELCLRQGDTADPPLSGVQLDITYLLE